MAAAHLINIRHHRARWYGPRLEALRADYEGTSCTLPELAARHGTIRAIVCRLARENGWLRHADRRGRLGRIPGTQGARQAA